MPVRESANKFDRPTPTKATAGLEQELQRALNEADVIKTVPGPNSKSGRSYFKATITLSDGRNVYLSVDTESQAKTKALTALMKAGFTPEQAQRMLEAADE